MASWNRLTGHSIGTMVAGNKIRNRLLVYNKKNFIFNEIYDKLGNLININILSSLVEDSIIVSNEQDN